MAMNYTGSLMDSIHDQKLNKILDYEKKQIDDKALKVISESNNIAQAIEGIDNLNVLV